MPHPACAGLDAASAAAVRDYIWTVSTGQVVPVALRNRMTSSAEAAVCAYTTIHMLGMNGGIDAVWTDGSWISAFNAVVHNKQTFEERIAACSRILRYAVPKVRVPYRNQEYIGVDVYRLLDMVLEKAATVSDVVRVVSPDTGFEFAGVNDTYWPALRIVAGVWGLNINAMPTHAMSGLAAAIMSKVQRVLRDETRDAIVALAVPDRRRSSRIAPPPQRGYEHWVTLAAAWLWLSKQTPAATETAIDLLTQHFAAKGRTGGERAFRWYATATVPEVHSFEDLLDKFVIFRMAGVYHAVQAFHISVPEVVAEYVRVHGDDVPDSYMDDILRMVEGHEDYLTYARGRRIDY